MGVGDFPQYAVGKLGPTMIFSTRTDRKKSYKKQVSYDPDHIQTTTHMLY